MELRLATLKAICFYLLHTVSTLNQCRKLSCVSGFGGRVVSMQASGTQDRGFKPGRSHRIFSGRKKNPEHAFLRKGSKAVGPVSYIYGT
jgi:hypothetical protein